MGSRVRAVLAVLSATAVALAGSHTISVQAGEVGPATEKDARTIIPIVSLSSIPTAADPTLTVQLSTRVQGTSTLAFLREHGPLLPLRLLFQPQKTFRAISMQTSDVTETPTPWKGGAVTIDIDNAVSRWGVADAAGVVRMNLADEIGRMPAYPRRALTVTVSAETRTHRDDKTFTLDVETARALYLRSADMSAAEPGRPPETVVSVRVEGDVLVVEVTNAGAGATSQLRGTLESPFPGLNGREMLFGRILPGWQRAWLVPLSFPETTRYAEIPIRIVFSERNGFVPGEVAATITVTRR